MKSRFAGLGFVLSSCLLVNPPSDVLPDVAVGGGAGIGGAGAGETGAAAGGKTGWSREALSAVAQRLIRQLLVPVIDAAR